jgi:hypothetical protein
LWRRIGGGEHPQTPAQVNVRGEGRQAGELPKNVAERRQISSTLVQWSWCEALSWIKPVWRKGFGTGNGFQSGFEFDT